MGGPSGRHCMTAHRPHIVDNSLVWMGETKINVTFYEFICLFHFRLL